MVGMSTLPQALRWAQMLAHIPISLVQASSTELDRVYLQKQWPCLNPVWDMSLERLQDKQYDPQPDMKLQEVQGVISGIL